MKRLALIIALAVAVSTLGAPVSMAFQDSGMSCCSDGPGCSQGLERASCCKVPAATDQAGAFMTVVRVLSDLTPLRTQEVRLEIACDGHPQSDKDEAPQEESSLYLQLETLLI